MSSHQGQPEIYFHVGLPKTASTFLQKKVFPALQGLHYIKKHDFKYRDTIIAKSQAERVLLSVEMKFDFAPDIKQIKDVAAKYPETTPIIFLRRHSSWLGSKYKYYIRKHGNGEFDHFFDFEHNNGIFKYENLSFYSKIKKLEEIFHNEPIVFFQEELKKAPFEVIDQLAAALGVSYNKDDINISNVKTSYSEKQLKVVRKFNRHYVFNKQKVKPGFRRFAYKKFSGLLLHSASFLALLIPDALMDNKPLIPKDVLEKVDDYYNQDWDKCVSYALRRREKVYL